MQGYTGYTITLRYTWVCRVQYAGISEGTFFIGVVGRGILEFFAKKVVALPLPGMDECMTLQKYLNKNI